MTRIGGAVILFFIVGSLLPTADLAASDPCAGIEGSLASVAKALDEGRWRDAGAFLQPLDPANSKCVDVVLGLAYLRAAQGNDVEAERLYSDALIVAPGNAAAHAHFARFQLSRGLGPQAARLTAQALSIDPDCVEALVVRGKIMGERELYGEARAVLEKAVALEPDNANAQHELGVWFFRVNLFDQAAKRFQAAVTLNPNRTRSFDYLGLSLEMLGEAEGAEEAFRSALELQTRGGPFVDPTLDYNVGRFLLKQGRLDESRPYLDRAVARFPNRRGPRYQRAKLHLAQGDFQSAREYGERALALGKPGDVVLDLQVYYLLTTIYSRLGEAELATEYAQKARDAEIPDQMADRQR